MGRKRFRGLPSAEMVRATVPTEADILQVRTLARRARLTFEALRGVYARRAASTPPSRGVRRNRADMSALSTMISSNLCLYRDKRIVGPVPGVFVGDVFNYRAELLVVGLHSHAQAGIGFVPASLVGEGKPVATSVVSYGGYLDDHDNGDVLLYAGTGGRPRNGRADQELEGGNLALAYSCKYGVEVRVIRCHVTDASPSGKVYVYDGLYKVESSTYIPGDSGREVCRFKLVRLPGQDPLGSNTWHAARSLVDDLDAGVRRPGYLTLDLSRGKEAIRVPVCNTVDQDRSPLDDTKYIARPRFPPPRLESRRRCCGYRASASFSKSRCACVKRNGGGGPPYNTDGTLVKGVPMVYECGAQCACPPSCPNRVTQRGMRHRLEVFRSAETEWGVRTLDLIQPGAFICEFSGDVVAAGASTDWDGYVDPRKFPPRWKEWGDASGVALRDHEGPPLLAQCPAPPAYVLDVSRRRNFAPYICHSGAPNAFIQFVVCGDESDSFPHLMVFALETIPPMRDLSIDYGIDQ
jgi:euchromatic histone-lysine N-methyltransferase